MKRVTIIGTMSFLAIVIGFIFSARSQNSAEELMASGNALLKNGAYSEAIGMFHKIVSIEPKNFEAQFNLAYAYQQADQYDKAVVEYNRAISLEPKNPDCWANLGYVYEKLGKTNKAVDAITRSINLNPGNVDTRMNLAALYEESGALIQAATQYEGVIKTDGSRGSAYSGVARCMTQKGNIAGAKKYLAEAITVDANNADAHWLLGNILWKKENKNAEALKEYEIAVRLDENSQVYYENLALLQEEMGKKDDALVTWKKYLIYLNEALKKEEVKNHIDKLENGDAVSGGKSEATLSNEQAAQEHSAHTQELINDLRKKDKPDARRIEPQTVDIGPDLDNIGTDTGSIVDIREEARKKAESKKDTR
jgi:tetratricopeptide (TPR) repeat protein